MPFDIRNKCTIGKAPLVKSKKNKNISSPAWVQWKDCACLYQLRLTWSEVGEVWRKTVPSKCSLQIFKKILTLGVYSPFMFTWASMKITLNSTVVNDKQMRNHLLKWPRPSVSGGGHLLFRLNDRVGKINKACWVKHPFIPLLEPDKGIPSQKFLSAFSSSII